MPRFEPFPGIRYDLDRVSIGLVTAPPYDVIDDNQRSMLVSGHEHNIVRIDLPMAEHGRDPYEVAPSLLKEWIDERVLIQDPVPCLYAYRMRYALEDGTERTTLGVVGALELSRPGEGGILPHEHTTPKAKSDRLEMLRVCNANLSSVWGLSPAEGLAELCTLDRDPDAEWNDESGVTHAFWVISDADLIKNISAAMESAPVVIADGHHRFETSLAYRDELRDKLGDDARPADFAMTYVVELAPDKLTVLPIHRLVRGLPDELDPVEALEPFFEFHPAPEVDSSAVRMLQEEGALCMLNAERAWMLVPRPETVSKARDLDTSRLDLALGALPEHELVFQHGVENVVERVRSGEFSYGFLLRPATVEQILAIADGGERMPPKTTFFHPKPRTGVVLRPL